MAGATKGFMGGGIGGAAVMNMFEGLREKKKRLDALTPGLMDAKRRKEEPMVDISKNAMKERKRSHSMVLGGNINNPLGKG